MKAGKYIWFLTLIFACNHQADEREKISKLNIKFALDSLGNDFLDKGTILGFSVTIDSSGITMYNGNFGYIDVYKTKPVDKDTRFDIASISKIIGVSVIMRLVEQGKLNLDQTLEELLPSFPEKELARKIRLRHLISHTSGLLDNTLEMDSLFLATGIIPERKDFFSYFPGKDLLYEPGSHYQYSNSGFIFMAFIAENVSNKSWQQLIDEIINKPTGLDFQLIKFAVDHSETSPIFNFHKENFYKVPTWVYVIGDGGLTATSEMLSKFPHLLARGDIILKSSFDEMVNPKQLNDGTKTGYGFGVRNGFFLEERIIGHTGGWKSTFAIMAYFPERDITFVAVMNTDDTPDNIYYLFSQFMSTYLSKPVPDYKKSFMRFENPSRLLGKYHGYGDEFDNEGTIVNIRQTNGQLFYCIDDSCDSLYYMGQNKFWLEQYPYDYIEFEAAGTSLAIKEYYYGLFQIHRKKID